MAIDGSDSYRMGCGDFSFVERESEEAAWLIGRGIAEDMPAGDATTQPLFGQQRQPLWLEADFVAREAGVLSGLPVVEVLFREHAADVQLEILRSDGDSLAAGHPFLRVRAPAASLLPLERLALNFLQRLSGIATVTARWIEEIRSTRASLLDTRKTTPGWRYLEKYAVRCGGGTNHRMNLSDGILLKDNHIAILSGAGRGDLATWVSRLRESGETPLLEVEVDTRDQFLIALDLEVDAILLDNFAVDDLRWAVEERDRRSATGPLLEASGGIKLPTARAVAMTGVDRISVGALTHSAVSLDIAIDVRGVFEQ